MRRCVFFDRDGIVNRPPPAGGYIKRREDFEIIPEFVDALRVARELGYVAAVVTNQRGVARGLVSRETVESIHADLIRVLRDEHGLELLDVLFCPHDEGECECRKPRPGMLLEAARRHDIDLKSSWMIGDDARDVDAGRRAGCRTVFVGRGPEGAGADVRVADMIELKPALRGVLSAGVSGGRQAFPAGLTGNDPRCQRDP